MNQLASLVSDAMGKPVVSGHDAEEAEDDTPAAEEMEDTEAQGEDEAEAA